VRLIVMSAIDILGDAVPNYGEAAAEKIPHA